MSFNVRFRPIHQWPWKRTASRKNAPFRAAYAKNLRDLERELDHLRATNVVIQAGFREEDIRQDGWPRSSARKPTDPGVILSFRSGQSDLSFPCDTYTTWEDNLRAICLSLTALRAVDRYGVTRQSEQYRGWTQLPPPARPTQNGFRDKVEASAFVAQAGGTFHIQGKPLADDALDTAYKAAARKLHPDLGGSTVDFQKLQDAMKILRGAA